jgi:hypothetical protein
MLTVSGIDLLNRHNHIQNSTTTLVSRHGFGDWVPSEKIRPHD